MPSFLFEHFEPENVADLIAYTEVPGASVALEPGRELLEVRWAADSAEALLRALRQAMGTGPRHLRIQFVPPEFEGALLAEGFAVAGEYADTWLTGLERMAPLPSGQVPLRPLTAADDAVATALTRSCRGLSRGFMGEPPGFAAEWLAEPHSGGLLALDGTEPVGVTFVQVYGHDSAKGPVLWLRELAVRPDCQGRGIGRELTQAALQWGRERGATRSFLHVDVQNHPAIRLYESLGYVLTPGRGQIDMCAEWTGSAFAPWLP